MPIPSIYQHNQEQNEQDEDLKCDPYLSDHCEFLGIVVSKEHHGECYEEVEIGHHRWERQRGEDLSKHEEHEEVVVALLNL